MPSKARWGFAAALFCAAAIVVFYASGFTGSCTMQQVAIEQDVKKYGKSHDPEFCADIDDRISTYDSLCGTQIQVVDCG